jgi:hypothetical protein
MNPIRTLGLAAAVALSLGAGAAMAQEGGNATMSGTTWPPPRVPQDQSGIVQSGSSDVQTQPATSNSHYRWTPGVPY